jgi:hypothetical protein
MPFGLSFYRILTLSLPVYTYIKIKQAQPAHKEHGE